MHGIKGGKYGRFRGRLKLFNQLEYLIRKLIEQANQAVMAPSSQKSSNNQQALFSYLPISVSLVPKFLQPVFAAMGNKRNDAIKESIKAYTKTVHAVLEVWFRERGGLVGGCKKEKGYCDRWGYHIIQFEPDDAPRTDNELMSIARETLYSALGDGNERPLIAVLHRDTDRPHVHLLYSLLGSTGVYLGRRISHQAMVEACLKSERTYGLAPHVSTTNNKGTYKAKDKAYIKAALRADKAANSWIADLQNILLPALNAGNTKVIDFFRLIYRKGVRAQLHQHANGRVGLIFSIEFKGEWKFASASKLIYGLNFTRLCKDFAVSENLLKLVNQALQSRPEGKKGIRKLTMFRFFRLLVRRFGAAKLDAELHNKVKQFMQARGLSTNKKFSDALAQIGIDLRLTFSPYSRVKLSFRRREDTKGIWLEYPQTADLKRLQLVCGISPKIAQRWIDLVCKFVAKNKILINGVLLPSELKRPVSGAAPLVRRTRNFGDSGLGR